MRSLKVLESKALRAQAWPGGPWGGGSARDPPWVDTADQFLRGRGDSGLSG